ncbi:MULTISPECIES: hypothetical protein [unclassified Lactococcus]|uniref:hypothetical protein n=1 Tax=unclassified Lactococcus TaxID=2643510 RepID=UPI0011C83690|nr:MULTISPECIES: hypothetical protein [unclassified Lactococcus]MQW22682.1 hypothetical protein [Lactococcus sp. dk101]TXK44690.1 hypothetical protein FVP42_03560 [Lactococcus sp. dk310]TXK50584.1 hypothetical protein FVP43_03560 [Lactococcus sp. dk322]
MDKQQAHEFALAFATTEYRRISEYELKTSARKVDITNEFAPLQTFLQLYKDAFREVYNG